MSANRHFTNRADEQQRPDDAPFAVFQHGAQTLSGAQAQALSEM